MRSKAKNAVQARASSRIGFVDEAINRLFNEISPLITAARERVAVGVNTELTKLNWNVGNCINREILGRGRAEYGSRLSRDWQAVSCFFMGLDGTRRPCGIVSALRRLLTRRRLSPQRGDNCHGRTSRPCPIFQTPLRGSSTSKCARRSIGGRVRCRDVSLP